MATQRELRQYLGSLSATLWNFGAAFPVPTLDLLDSTELGFSFDAASPVLTIPC